MVLDLVIIGLVVALLPLTIVAFTLILGAQQGIRKGLAFIAGWMACQVAGPGDRPHDQQPPPNRGSRQPNSSRGPLPARSIETARVARYDRHPPGSRC